MITGIIEAMHGSPEGIILALKTNMGVVKIDLPLETAKLFAKKYEVDEDTPKDLLMKLTRKVYGKKVEINIIDNIQE